MWPYYIRQFLLTFPGSFFLEAVLAAGCFDWWRHHRVSQLFSDGVELPVWRLHCAAAGQLHVSLSAGTRLA